MFIITIPHKGEFVYKFPRTSRRVRLQLIGFLLLADEGNPMLPGVESAIGHEGTRR